MLLWTTSGFCKSSIHKEKTYVTYPSSRHFPCKFIEASLLVLRTLLILANLFSLIFSHYPMLLQVLMFSCMACKWTVTRDSVDSDTPNWLCWMKNRLTWSLGVILRPWMLVLPAPGVMTHCGDARQSGLDFCMITIFRRVVSSYLARSHHLFSDLNWDSEGPFWVNWNAPSVTQSLPIAPRSAWPSKSLGNIGKQRLFDCQAPLWLVPRKSWRWSYSIPRNTVCSSTVCKVHFLCFRDNLD